jgi:hypothetical protein
VKVRVAEVRSKDPQHPGSSLSEALSQEAQRRCDPWGQAGNKKTIIKERAHMRIEFIDKENGPKNLIGEAEILFESEDGLLAGLKLVGFSLWRTEKGEPSVTMPSRSWGDAGERKFFDLLRGGDGGGDAVRRLKTAMCDQHRLRDRNAA